MTDATRRRTVMSLALGVLLAMLASTPTGSADEIEERKDRVELEIGNAEERLDQSSAELTAADQRLANAVSQLAVARTSLAETRGQLVAARALDRRMQAELADAVQDLARTRAALTATRASVSRREDALRAVVVHQHASGGSDLMALSTVLNTQDTGDLARQLSSYKNVLDAEAATLARLAASQVTLRVQESAFEDLKREVAARRAAAAANLAEKARLQAQAQQAASRIGSLVALRSEARQAADQARTEDLRQLEQLEQEKADISQLLERRAEEARKAAEAAEAAEAAAGSDATEPPDRPEPQPEPAEQPDPPAPEPAEQPDSPVPAATPSTSTLAYPVDGYLTSSYGMRFHPIYKYWKLHDGTDFGAPCGTPVRAAADGIVLSMYYNSGYGNRIIMDHGLRDGVGLGTTYNHLSGFSASVGQHVQQGDVIGYVGTTGASTGCHLHFMVFENGATVDPMTWL